MESNLVTTNEQLQVNGFSPNVAVNVSATPLTKDSLVFYDEAKQQEILRVAEQIDVTQLDRIVSYGQIPLLRIFESAGKILKEEEGTTADQEVMKQVIELSKKANQSYEDFNITLQEPNLLEKILLKISSKARDKHDKDLKVKAITNYRLLAELKKSCEEWLLTLQDSYSKITLSACEDKMVCDEIEQYIVAGRIAEARVEEELQLAKQEWETSGIQEAENRYNDLKDGLDTFKVVLFNLEKSRNTCKLSIAQLKLSEKSNKNIQIAMQSQKANSMAVASQQLRNAILDAKNKQGAEGQKFINKLNDSLIVKVSQNMALTAEESEELLLNGVYTIESSIEAVKTVIAGYEAIKKAHEGIETNIAAGVQKLKESMETLEPYISRVKEPCNTNDNNTTSSATVRTPSRLSF